MTDQDNTDPQLLDVEPYQEDKITPEQAEAQDSKAPQRCMEFKGNQWWRRGSKNAYYYRNGLGDLSKPELTRIISENDQDFSFKKALPARRSQTLYGADGRFRMPEYARNQLARGFKKTHEYSEDLDDTIEIDSRLGIVSNKSAHEYWPTFVRDVFGALYGMQSTDVGQNEPSFAKEYLDAIEDSESLKKIRAASKLDSSLALKTAQEILHQVATPAPETPKQRNERGEGKEQESPERGKKAAQLHEQNMRAIESAMADAARAAQEIIDKKGQSDDTPGHGQGNVRFSGHSHLDEKFKRIEPEEVRNISEIAGRAMSTAYNARAKNAAVPGGITDVECGRDVRNWLPAELALLADSDTEMLAFARYAERSALQFKMENDGDMGRGEIVLFIDLSSSMFCDDIIFKGRQMNRNVWAAGVALALWQVATWQGRTCRLIGYSAGVCFDETVKNEKQATEILSRKYGGGTSLGEAITYVVNEGYSKLADFVVVSDGEDWNWEGAAKLAKEKNDVRLHAVAISGEWRNTEELESYTHVTGDNLDLTEQYSAL